MQQSYYIHWIDTRLTYRPTLFGSPRMVLADTPEKAWRQFYASHPNLRDGEGDYYIMIRSGAVPRDDETDIIAEAGVDSSGNMYFNKW